jgi:SAM-dependent methyltransferase
MTPAPVCCYNPPKLRLDNQGWHMDFDILQRIREDEMKRILPLMTPGERVLEIGGGAGWQAKMIADYGLQVVSVDLAQTFYRELQAFPVVVYDGHRLPVKSHSVDVIFSSNVLEHVAHIEAFETELMRVLKPGGRAIHVLPTTSWRLWTSVTHPLYHMITQTQRLLNRRENAAAGSQGEDAADSGATREGLLSKIRRGLFAPRHGEFGNTLTELFYFNQLRWRRHFNRTCWVVERCLRNELFYTGYTLWSNHISMETREALSYFLGASCMIYVLRPKASGT